MAREKKIKCPECGANVDLESYLDIGDTTVCSRCDAELRIIEVDPPQVETVELAANDLGFESEDEANYDDDEINNQEDIE
jgi:alpha-aminoadipate carrier protein LysW